MEEPINIKAPEFFPIKRKGPKIWMIWSEGLLSWKFFYEVLWSQEAQNTSPESFSKHEHAQEHVSNQETVVFEYDI